VEAFDAYPGQGMDTIVSFDPETYEEKLEFRPKEMNIEGDFIDWRLRQILFYNAKKAVWGTKVVAVAPLMNITKLDSIVGTKPIFWFKADEKPQKLSANSIVWAKKTLNKQATSKVPVLPDKLLKISKDVRNPVEHLWERIKNDPKMVIYDPNNENPFTPKDRTDLSATRVDTIVTFDLETYEEKTVEVRNELNPDDVNELRLIQHWYWDERRGRLSITLEAVGLIIKVFDDFGEYRYSRLLCYRRVK
jgi:hypothetical protein